MDRSAAVKTLRARLQLQHLNRQIQTYESESRYRWSVVGTCTYGKIHVSPGLAGQVFHVKLYCKVRYTIPD